PLLMLRTQRGSSVLAQRSLTSPSSIPNSRWRSSRLRANSAEVAAGTSCNTTPRSCQHLYF
ncbi:MAG: hypothetical protein ACK55Z_20845, partial [bacterium]